MGNYAFIDGQNLHLGTRKAARPWKIDLTRLRAYLTRKYDVSEAYYFIGVHLDEHAELYGSIADAGYRLVFRAHSETMRGSKKGNVDTDIVFSVMRDLYLREPFERVVIISGDGDYKRMVDFLIEIGRFEKILFPDMERASSLYRSLGWTYFDSLGRDDMRRRLEKMKGEPRA